MEEAAQDVAQARQSAEKAQQLGARISLLYGPASASPPDSAHMRALESIDCLNGALSLLEGRTRPRLAIQAVLAAQAGETPWADVYDLTGADIRRFEALRGRLDLPPNFDPLDDRSVAGWALAHRYAATDAFAKFVEECVRVIHQDHPGRIPRKGYAKPWRLQRS